MDIPTTVLSQYIKEILEEDQLKNEKMQRQDDEEDENQPINIVQEPRSRGRPRIPLRWTRMISLYGDDLSKVRCFDLATDLLIDNAMDKAPVHRRGDIEFEPLFWPKHFLKQLNDHTLEGHKLSDTKLRVLGKHVTKMRTKLRETAAKLPTI